MTDPLYEVRRVFATNRQSGRERPVDEIDRFGLEARVDEILSRWPAVGLAVGAVRDGRLEFFRGHGVADIESGTPITEDTVFRIASITKTFTAVAVMQLWERGLIDLDAPANDYLRSYSLIPSNPGFGPATVRHLLTHTAGIPDVLRLSDLMHLGWGPPDARPAAHSVEVGEPLPSLGEVYGGGLRVVAEPGTRFAYSNHGFATLGQIVEEVGGEPLNRYFGEHIFAPLGMADTALTRSELAGRQVANGYVIGSTGARPVADRDWVTVGASNIYSTPKDVARFVAALLGGVGNECGSVLEPGTLATMFEPHYVPDRRLPGMGLGFFRHDVGGHLALGHEGILPGFNAQLLVTPDDGVGVIAFTNGASRARLWLPAEVDRLLRGVLGIGTALTLFPQHPEVWGDLCGRYLLPRGVSDLRGRVMMGAGAHVFVHRGRLMVRLLTPVPALFRGIQLDPADEHDPYVFRLDLSQFGMGAARVVFKCEPGHVATEMHTDLGLLSLYKRSGDVHAA